MSPELDPLNVFLLTRVASTEGFFFFAAVIALFLFLRKEWRRARSFVVATLGLALSTTVLKIIVAAPRPAGGLVEVTGYGFPSGHAAGIMFLALSACLLATNLPRLWRYVVYAAGVALAVAIATSRVYLSVHTPLQVFAGLALGALWVLVFVALSHRKV